jgi:hypothetical protein
MMEDIIMNSKNLNKEQYNRRRDILSTLWIFLAANYILCDVLSNMESSVLKGLLEGKTAGIEMNQGFLLAAGISLEIPFFMIVLSKVLKFRINKMINIIAGLFMAIYQLGSFFVGSAPSLHYIFFSAIEIIGNLFIVGYAWKWSELQREEVLTHNVE